MFRWRFSISWADLHTANLSAIEIEDYQKQFNDSFLVPARMDGVASITILDDDVMEWTESFTVEITGAAVGKGITSMNVTIVDDDRK